MVALVSDLVKTRQQTNKTKQKKKKVEINEWPP